MPTVVTATAGIPTVSGTTTHPCPAAAVTEGHVPETGDGAFRPAAAFDGSRVLPAVFVLENKKAQRFPHRLYVVAGTFVAFDSGLPDSYEELPERSAIGQPLVWTTRH